MNDLGGFAADCPAVDELEKRLSRLRPLPRPDRVGPGSDAEFIRNLAARVHLQFTPLRFCRKLFSTTWDAVLISALISLLAWDLLRIIRLLLN